jgi:uncharacterized protein (DUF885 family)
VSPDEKFDLLTKEMMERFLNNNPDLATQLGRHDPYDYLLPDGSTKRLLMNLEWEEEFLNRLEETVHRDELNDDHRLDWEVLERIHRYSAFTYHEHRLHELNPDAFDVLGGLVFIMLTRDYAPLENRMDAIASRLENVPRYLKEFRSRFEKSTPVKLWTEVALESAQGTIPLFQSLLQIAKGQVSEKTYDRLSHAVEKLAPELEKHVKWLNSLVPRATSNWALGREKYEKLIALRDLGMTPEQILRLGEDYLRKLKAEREQLVQQIAPGKTAEYVQKKIEMDAPKTFQEALAFTEKTMEEAKEFVQKRGLATVYPGDKLHIRETPAFMAPLIPSAALMMPAKYDKPQIGIYVVTKPKEMANLGKFLNYKFIRNIAVHEAYPGHFLQGCVSNRKSVLRVLISAPETVEGWAHYCEEMMAEQGFNPDKETKLIQVGYGIFRAVRIILDVKLSRGEMAFDYAVNMLVEEVGMSREGATAEVRRYTLTPGYPLSYLLGKHLILQLKKDVKKRMGNKFTEKFFHDTVIANGYLPFSLVRNIFNQKLEDKKKLASGIF